MIPTLEKLRAWIADFGVFASQARRRQVLIQTGLVVVGLAVGTFLISQYIPTLTDQDRLREFLRGFGSLGPVVLVGLQVLQVVLAPIPGQLLAVVAGYLYGPWWGTVYNMIGITVGSAIAFWLSRRYGRMYVERVVSDKLLDRFDAIADSQARAGLFVIFLVPGLPDDAICFIGGLTALPLWQLVVIAVVGRAPAFFFVNLIGDSFEAGQLGVAAGLAVIVVVIAVVGYLSRDRLATLFSR